MKSSDFIIEAANPAQQAAIAISMKKAGKKPKNEAMPSTFTRKNPNEKREPLKSFAEVAAWLGVSSQTLKTLRLRIPGFPNPVEGVRAAYGSHSYYRPSEIKPWVRNNNVLDIIKRLKLETPVQENTQIKKEISKAYGSQPLTESELRSVFGTFYLIEDLPLEKGIDQVKSSAGFFQKIKNFFAIWPKVLGDMVTGWLREGKQGGEAFMIWLQNVNCKLGRIPQCPSKERIDWALSQRADLAKMVSHFVLIGVLSAAVTSGLAQAGVVDAVQSIPFGTDFGTILNKLNSTIADNVALGFIIKSLGFVLKKSIWEMVLQGVEVLSRYFNITTIAKSLHSLHPNKADAPTESIGPGDLVRTKNMSQRGIVESVELYRPFNELAVYFRDTNNQLLRTPISNVIRIPIGA